MDREDPNSKTGLFNIHAFAIFLNTKRIMFNLELLIDDTNDVPGINDAYDCIKKSKAVLYSKIDHANAYHQIPLRRADRKVCAFTCDKVHYQFVTVPLGLKTVPSVFQRWIKILLKDCADFTVNHIDDIIVYSNSIEEHAKHVQKVLNALTAVSLTINYEKCHFFCTRLPVLGYILEVGGVKPDLKRVFNMLSWDRPNNRKKLQSLLGIINFFRKFIPHATEMMYPIMRIKGKTFDWYKQAGAEKAYNNIYKTLVTKGPFLHFPIDNIPIELATDASEHAIGATLFQVVNGEFKFLGFNSRVLKDAELRYSIPKKELVSIIHHVKYYRHLLYGKQFRLHTDSEALTAIFRDLDSPKKNATLAGWLADLAEYTFSLHHISGKKNLLPDLASRVQAIRVYKNQATWSEAELQDLFKSVHSIGHWGATLMRKHIQQTLNIRNVRNLQGKCLQFVKSCKECNEINSAKIPFAPLLESKIWRPFESVQIDLAEMHPSDTGYRYILVVIDEMTGYVLLRPLLSKSKEEIVDNLQKVFCEFGFPHRLNSDEGGEFVNALMKRLLTATHTKHQVMIPGDKRGTSKAERACGMVKDTLLKLTKSLEGKKYINKWQDLLHVVQFSMNIRIHSFTDKSPMTLMFGRHPFQYAVERDADIENSRQLLQQFWKTYMSEIPPIIKDLKDKHHIKYEAGYKPRLFKKGQYVSMRLKRVSKMDNRYTEPYAIEEVLPNGNYLLNTPTGTKEAPAMLLKAAEKPAEAIKDDIADIMEDVGPLQLDDLVGVDDQNDKSFEPTKPIRKSQKRQSKQHTKTTTTRNNLRKPKESTPTVQPVRPALVPVVPVQTAAMPYKRKRISLKQ